MHPRASSITYKKGHQLLIAFENGEEKLFDLKPYLSYPVYEKLSDEAYCAKAAVQNGIVVWDNETDFDPDRLYLESEPTTVFSK